MVSFTSLFALALAVTGAVATTGTAVAYTFGNTSSLPCLGSGVSTVRKNIVKNVLANGNYIVVPASYPLANCGSLVNYINSDVSRAVDYGAYAVGVSPPAAPVGLGPASWAESSNGAESFNITYIVSPTGGRR
ncbi:hypothetical protein FB451DRAFT_1216413 [Mycena latifolia]|nr:hypothetical protein FB451DRAFT_1216413 [Mycena latifolia]